MKYGNLNPTNFRLWGKKVDAIYILWYNTLHIDIAKQGRKCDLDILVHDKNESVRKAVARHGYDDHLNILKKENKPNINYIINELRWKREL